MLQATIGSNLKRLRWLAGVLLAVAQLACSTTATVPDNTPNMPAARAGLRPEYRLFYDELGDSGDWVLIEPYGFVFRPRTRFANWSPYYDGFWSPSDSYGWVWVSGEPFGWATYHYGRWIDDDFQGWVWVPGLDWAPAWVAWTGNDQVVGWAALGPGGGFDTPSPGSNFHFVARSDMGSTDLRTKLLNPDQARVAARTAQPIENLDEVERVLVNRGPKIEWVEQAAGPLRRARVQDVITTVRDKLEAERNAPQRTAPGLKPRDDLQKAADAEARRVRTVMQNKQAQPDVIPRFKPAFGSAPQAKPTKAGRGMKPAPPDTSR